MTNPNAVSTIRAFITRLLLLNYHEQTITTPGNLP